MKLIVFLGLLLGLPISIFGLSGLESDYIQSGWQVVFLIYLIRCMVFLFSVMGLIFFYENLSRESGNRLSFIPALLLVVGQTITFVSKSVELPLQLEIAKNLQNIDIAKTEEIGDGYLLIDGYLGKTTVQSLNAYLSKNSLIGIILNSQGGIIDDAKSISKSVKDHRVNVYVKDRCESSCVIIATSGQKLFAYRNSQFGFHKAGLPASKKNSQNVQFVSSMGSQEMTEALAKNGVPIDILNKMNETSNDSMAYYSGLELHQKGVVDNLLD